MNLRQKVIPNYISVSHINNQFSIGGFIGSHHDVANLLTILLLFFISYFKISNNTTNKFFILPIIFCGTIALFFTNSASNIAVFLLFLFIMFVFIIKRSNNLIDLIKYLSFGIIALLIINWFNLNYLKIDSFLLKFEPLYEGFVKNSFNEVSIFNALDFDTIIKSSFFLLIGFADHFNLPININEIGFLRLWLKLGLIPFIILSFILFSPIYFISRAKKYLKLFKEKYPNEFLNNKLKINYLYDRLFLCSMPVLGGTMTLLHYGSLFRSTSIGVWCLVLAYFLKQYINFIKIISIK